MRKDPAIVRKSKNGDVNGIGSTTESESEGSEGFAFPSTLLLLQSLSYDLE